jgi:hypothetical protein
LCAWATFQAEALDWVESSSTTGHEPSIKLKDPEQHLLYEEGEVLTHLVDQLVYPSYTGLFSPDLMFTTQAPPLPAAGES